MCSTVRILRLKFGLIWCHSVVCFWLPYAWVSWCTIFLYLILRLNWNQFVIIIWIGRWLLPCPPEQHICCMINLTYVETALFLCWQIATLYSNSWWYFANTHLEYVAKTCKTSLDNCWYWVLITQNNISINVYDQVLYLFFNLPLPFIICFFML